MAPPREPVALESGDAASSLQPAAPASETGPGFSVAPAPLGLDVELQLIIEAHPASPDSLLADWTPRLRGGIRRRRPTLRGGSPGARGRDGDESSKSGEEASPQPGSGRAWNFVREQLSPEGIAQLQAMIAEPALALTVAQQTLIRRIGQYGAEGDRSGVRRVLLDLVEKLGVSSPTDGAVLDGRGSAGDESRGTPGIVGPLESGKQPIGVTQGARVLQQLQPILATQGGFSWKDGMDRAWQRLTERFGLQAKGTVDVIVDKPAGIAVPVAPSGPAGAWNPPTGAQNPPATGVWMPPTDAPAAPAAGVWTPPADPPKAPAAGVWTPPTDAPTARAVGVWTPPADAAAAGPSAPSGTWIPPETTSGAGSGGNRPVVGQWTPPPDEQASPRPGEWAPPAESRQPAPAETGRSTASIPPQVGKWISGDIPIGPNLRLSEILEKNPNISNVRLVELVAPSQSGQPSRLNAVADVARSVLAARFGVR